MVAPERCALIVLAAGRSTRFGGAKLEQPLGGRPLGLHVADALAVMPFGARIAVTGAARLDYAGRGFREVANPDPARGLSSSITLGIAAAAEAGVAAAVVVLADMPRVTPELLQRLLVAADGKDAMVASGDGTAQGPPAVFGRGRFAQLRALSGDRGARDLLAHAFIVTARPGELVDVDTPDALDRLRSAS